MSTKSTKKDRIISFFQAFGKSMLVPIAILAAIGIIVGLTAALNRPQVAALLPFMGNEHVAFILLTIRSISLELFNLIPVLFAISIAFGMAKKEREIAALAGFIAFYVLMFSSSLMVNSDYIHFADTELATFLGVRTINMGALGGIIAGLFAMMIHNKFYNLKLPAAFSFFGGKRSVAIITFVSMAALGLFIPFIWRPIAFGMSALGEVISSLGLFGIFIYGFLEKLMLPTGLHHVIINLFRTTALGGSMLIDGTYVDGALSVVNALVGTVPTQELAIFTRFMGQGRMPIHLFGLPAAALAMYHVTPDKRKAIVKPLLIAGTLSVFTTGITEPLEFLFLFTAPMLFLFHAVMTGIGFVLMAAFNVVIANTQGGIIDFLVFGTMVEDSNWLWILVGGLPYIPIYYFVFKWYLTKKNVVIADGVDGDIFDDAPSTTVNAKDNLVYERAMIIIDALGGQENIVDVYNCLTRLRCDVKDTSLVKEKELKSTKAIGVNVVSNTHVQVIYGAIVEEVAEEVKDALGIA